MGDESAKLPSFPLKLRLNSAASKFLFSVAVGRDGTVNRRLLNFTDVRDPPSSAPIDGVTTSDHVVDPARNLTVRLFCPSTSAATLPVVVYFHGGGLIFCSASSRNFDSLCRRISRLIPARVVSVDYRLAPEHRHPAAYDDGADVLQWLDSGDLISDLSAVFLAGDSAGGNIAHHVARRVAMKSSSPFRRMSVVGVVALQPFFGGESETESERRLDGAAPLSWNGLFRRMWRAFLPVGSDLDHEAANVFGPGSRTDSDPDVDWTRYPETMVVVGGLDGLQDRQRWYYEGLKRVGVVACLAEYPSAIHGAYLFPELGESEVILDDVAAFVRRRSNQTLAHE